MRAAVMDVAVAADSNITKWQHEWSERQQGLRECLERRPRWSPKDGPLETGARGGGKSASKQIPGIWSAVTHTHPSHTHHEWEGGLKCKEIVMKKHKHERQWYITDVSFYKSFFFLTDLWQNNDFVGERKLQAFWNFFFVGDVGKGMLVMGPHDMSLSIILLRWAGSRI